MYGNAEGSYVTVCYPRLAWTEMREGNSRNFLPRVEEGPLSAEMLRLESDGRPKMEKMKFHFHPSMKK